MQPQRRLPGGDRFSVHEQSAITPVGRWTIALATPRGPLGPLVESVWASRGEGLFTQEDILPRSPTEVLFALGETHWLRDRANPVRDRSFTRAFVSGLQLSPLAVESPPDAEMAGIRLRPAGAAAFLRDSPATIAGSVVDLDALMGTGVESLRDQLGSQRCLRTRALLLAAAVERHMSEAPALAHPLLGTLRRLVSSRGNVSVRELVVDAGWSHRHFVQRFRSGIGLGPKSFARIVRFESAFARLQQVERVDWAGFALDCGYYDQAHLIREFRELAGATPAQVLRRRAPDGLGLLDEAELPARV
jgi:AraC-like DNA-binding protein